MSKELLPNMPQEGPIPIGSRIRALRWEKGVTVRTLAKALIPPVEDSFISNIERGRENLSDVRLVQICEALRVAPDILRNASRGTLLNWLSKGPPSRASSQNQLEGGELTPPVKVVGQLRLTLGDVSFDITIKDAYINPQSLETFLQLLKNREQQ